MFCLRKNDQAKWGSKWGIASEEARRNMNIEQIKQIKRFNNW